MKKILSVLLTLVLCLSAAGFAHIDYIDSQDEISSQYGSDNYLYDTLTIAGSGVGDQVLSYTVYDLETMARNESLGLCYENTYSLMTSGGVYSHSVYSGVLLYELLELSGLDESLPDSTPVKAISKDGYSISLTLGSLRSGIYSRFASASEPEAEETGLPVIVAFSADGYPLVGPTGAEPIYKDFSKEDGYVASADNIGGPLRLIIGQTASTEFNAPNCSKWLSAIIVGDAGDYVYERDTDDKGDMSEPEPGGDWTHGGDYAGFRLTISGSQAKNAVLTLSELESLTDIADRGYYAASAGKNAFEGIILRELVELYTADGIDKATSVTVVSEDGYSKQLDINDLYSGIESRYQPGKHKDILLAYAIDGSALVEDADSENYNGSNAFGPLRLVVENTISVWVKNVTQIIIGEPEEAGTEYFSDLGGYTWAKEAIDYLYDAEIVNGLGNGLFGPGANIKRGDFILMLYRAYGFKADADDNFTDVEPGSHYYEAIAAAKALGIAQGDGASFNPKGSITRQDAMTLIHRTLAVMGIEIDGEASLESFSDAEDIADYARAPIAQLVSAQVINGSDGKILPQGYMTRAEMSVALFRALTNL